MTLNATHNQEYQQLRRLVYSDQLIDSLFEAQPNQKKFKNKFYAHQLSKLEDFVNQVVSTTDQPFTLMIDHLGRQKYSDSAMSRRYFESIPDFIEVVTLLSPQYDYNEPINAFIAAARALNLLDQPLPFKCFSKAYIHVEQLNGLTSIELFNALVDQIRLHWRVNNIKAKVYIRRFEAQNRYQDYCRYVDSLFDQYARIVVLRLDLSYQKDCFQTKSVEDISADLDHLIANQRANAIFDYMIGYIAKLEFGIEKGLHWHLIFFFDGSKRAGNSHVYLAQQIGEYWVETITKGQGVYWNVNDNAKDYARLGRLGIGVINWNDTDLRRNLNHVLQYLCKVAQFIRPKTGRRVRLMRRGQYPEMQVTKRGRPRQG